MRPIGIIVALTALACGPVIPADETTRGTTSDDGTVGSEDVTTAVPTTSTTTSATTTSTTTASTTTASPETSDAEDDGVQFIEDPDGGGRALECSLWDNDCPRGFKCMPWSNDGGNAWNATKCTPLAEDPNAVGEPCTVVDSGVSGIDDCEAGAMCWNIDPETLMGECVGFCTGSEANPTCTDPCTRCNITGEGVLILCLPTCDPLAQDCGEGQGCYPTNDVFSCVPDAGGDPGALGDPCEFLNVCDPGLFCGNAESVFGCDSMVGCCTPFCDLTAADPCPGLPAVECMPWYEAGQAPEGCGAELVGGCLLPE